jgi:hypothetical protein
MTGNTWYVKNGHDPVWDSWPQFRAEGEALASAPREAPTSTCT